MSRVLLQYLLPLILPTVLYLIWALAVRDSGSGRKLATILREGPWFWLIVAGMLLAGASLVFTALSRGGDPSGRYVAPRLENGRVIPGHIE
jgi:bacteriorhodopsin